MGNFDMPSFLMHWELFASVDRPYSDTLGWPENTSGVLGFYDGATQRRIQLLVQYLEQAIFCEDANGNATHNHQVIYALEQCGFDVAFDLTNPGDRHIAGSVARDDRCLYLTAYN